LANEGSVPAFAPEYCNSKALVANAGTVPSFPKSLSARIRIEHGSDHRLKLDVASILKEQLQVFGIESELPDRATHRVRRRPVGRGTCPPIFPAGVFKSQMAAVFEKHRRLRERGIGDVACRLFFREV